MRLLSLLCLALPACAAPESLLRVTGDAERGGLWIRQEQFAGPPGMPDLVLLNLLHLGSKEYYAAIQRQCDAADLVLMEGVRVARPAAAAEPRPAALAATGQHRRLAAQLGLQFQGDCLQPRPNWRWADLELDQYRRLARRAAPRRIAVPDLGAALRDEVFFIQSREGLGLAAARRRALHGSGRRLLAERLQAAATARSDELARAREAAVLQSLRPASGTWVLAWGHAHGPGLAAALRRRGYRLRLSRWQQVFGWAPDDPVARGRGVKEGP